MKHPIIIATDELLSEMDALQIRGGVGEVQGLYVLRCNANDCVTHSQQCPVTFKSDCNTSCELKASECAKDSACTAVKGTCLEPHKFEGCKGLI